MKISRLFLKNPEFHNYIVLPVGFGDSIQKQMILVADKYGDFASSVHIAGGHEKNEIVDQTTKCVLRQGPVFLGATSSNTISMKKFRLEFNGWYEP